MDTMELADLAIERLRESIDAGGNELPVDERRLTRARRAVEKAAAILAEPDEAEQQRVLYPLVLHSRVKSCSDVQIRSYRMDLNQRTGNNT
jgi:hypothetical protein